MSRAAYDKWLNHKIPENEIANQRIAEEIEKIHMESPDKGYRRIRDDPGRYHDIKVNDKRVLRVCRQKNIKSTIKYCKNGCTRQAAKPQYVAENILNREFGADAPNQKWLTDVTEFKYYGDGVKHKVYLSAILDLYDRRIVPYIIGQIIMDLYLILLMQQFWQSLMHIPCVIVTEDFNIQTGSFIRSWLRLE